MSELISDGNLGRKEAVGGLGDQTRIKDEKVKEV